MTATPQQALLRLRELADSGELDELCRAVGIDVLVAFGSVVDPTTAPHARDLDLAVVLGDGADVLRVVNVLVSRLHCDDIDVLDLARAGPVAQEQALVATMPLYERVPGSVAAIRDRAIMRRMDTAWLRRLDLELMASP
jgi:predicted nucleotidyltransferase